MTENTDKITVTLKADASAPWVVIHANSADEAHELLGQVYGGTQSLSEHAALAAMALSLTWRDERAKHIQEGSAVGRVAQAVGGTVVQEQAQPQGQNLQAPPSCIHGERVFREGNGAKGPWAAYFCPTPKDTPGQCKPLFRDKKTGQFS